MERLRMERARQALTLGELAKRSGVAPGTISELERGARRAYPSTLVKLAKGLGVPVEELTGGSARSPKAEAPPQLEDSERGTESPPKREERVVTSSIAPLQGSVEISEVLDVIQRISSGELSREEAEKALLERVSA